MRGSGKGDFGVSEGGLAGGLIVGCRGQHGFGFICTAWKFLGSDFEVSDGVGMICLESERNIAKTLYIPKIPYVINYH